jgi:predicted transcriptional regulator
MGSFGELEAAVMARLWADDAPQSVRTVLLALQQDRPLAYTTVMTVMERLFRKGLLQRTEDSKAYLYSPTLSRADHTAQVMEQALTETADRGAALVHFADRISAKEAKTLLAALASRRGRDKRPR